MLLLLLLLLFLLLLQLLELAVAFFRWAEEYEGEDLDRMLRGGGGGVLVEQKLFVFLLVLLLLVVVVLFLMMVLLSLHPIESLLESAIIGDNDRAQLRLRPPIIFLGGGGDVSILFWLKASATAEPVRGVKI